MRSLLFPATILLALAATTGLALIAFRPTRPPEEAAGEPSAPTPHDRAPAGQPERPLQAASLRRYQTTATLAEDLRDALAQDPVFLGRECWRVSKALQAKARWTLLHVAREEASPKVRALLVLAAGVHAQDETLLLGSLSDARALVRRAAALATGYTPAGKRRAALIEGVEVPLGRRPPPETEQILRRHYMSEKDPAVRADMAAVLEAGGLSRPR